MRPLSITAKQRLLNRSINAIHDLTHRLITCRIEDYPKVERALDEERKAFAILQAVPVKVRRQAADGVV